MTALTKARKTSSRIGAQFSAPVAAGVVIYHGSLVALDALGDATPGAVATTLQGFGKALATVDNSGGAAGAVSVTVEKGLFAYENSSAGDLIDRSDIGNDAYIVDDQTVAKTDGGGTRSVAGKIMDVDAEGVWIEFN